MRADRRAYRVRVGSDRLNTCNRLGFAGDLIDEVEADIPARPFIGHQRRQRRQSPPRRLGGQHSVLLQAAENVGEPLLGTPRMPVGVEVIRPLGQASKERGFLERELLRRLAEVAARRHLNAPGAAAQINRIEIKLENFRLGQRMLDTRSHDHLADLALIGQVLAHQQVLDDLLSDG